jgi:hypothetical protein
MTLVAVRDREIPSLAGLKQSISGEVVVFCPGCKALQTVQISGDKLVPTRKFIQEGPYIYHDCGSIKPCRLYQNM